MEYTKSSFFALVSRASLAAFCAFTLNISESKATIMPENNLWLEDNRETLANMTEAEFNVLADQVIEHYKPLAKIHGGRLSVVKNWTNSTVNASANQGWFGSWVVRMYGGLARRPEVTPDGFTLVVCHEVGHHLAGFPFISAAWASNEGQSDYFASQVCAKAIWGKDRAVNAKYRQLVSPIAKQACDTAYRDTDEQNLCYRTAEAGLSLATLLSALKSGGVPKFDTPDLGQVTATNSKHPAAQCRLDTYLSGALCGKAFNQKLIPGRKHPKGQMSIEAEQIAAANSCFATPDNSAAARPRCWFKPRIGAISEDVLN